MIIPCTECTLVRDRKRHANASEIMARIKMKKKTKESRATAKSKTVTYEGHDLALAGMDTIWAVGRTPDDAIRALCEARYLGELQWGTVRMLPSGDTDKYTWGCRFKAGNGLARGQATYRAAGIHVPGGVVLTWWMQNE